MTTYRGLHTPYDVEDYESMIDRLWAPQIAPHRRVTASGKDVTLQPELWPDWVLADYASGWRPRYYDHEAPVEPTRKDAPRSTSR